MRYTTIVCRFTRFKSIKQAITVGRMADSEDEEIPPERDVKVVFKLTLYRFLFAACDKIKQETLITYEKAEIWRKMQKTFLTNW